MRKAKEEEEEEEGGEWGNSEHRFLSLDTSLSPFLPAGPAPRSLSPHSGVHFTPHTALTGGSEGLEVVNRDFGNSETANFFPHESVWIRMPRQSASSSHLSTASHSFRLASAAFDTTPGSQHRKQSPKIRILLLLPA